VTSAAIVCGFVSTLLLLGLSSFFVLVLGADAFWQLDESVRNGEVTTYIIMNGVAVILAVSFAAVIAYRLSRESRRLEHATGVLRSRLEREKGVSALGAHAAATAHELGSPLSTIAVIASELAKDERLPADVVDELNQLRDETRRCRNILGDLARRGEYPSADDVQLVPLHVTIDRSLHRMPQANRSRFKLSFFEGERKVDPRIDYAPFLPDTPGVTLAFKSFFENALRFARGTVDITCTWSAAEISILVRDDGPGFSKDILERLGEPFVKDHHSPGLGLGIFTAQALLERAGARVTYRNSSKGEAKSGAEVSITWRRDALTQKADLA